MNLCFYDRIVRPGSHTGIGAIILVGVLLSACGKPSPVVEDIRPVRALKVSASPVDVRNTYAGEVRPRFESALGFRVAGKIQQRLVNVGDQVHSGQVLARLDPKDLTLSEAGSRAGLAAQQAQLGVESADLERDRKLLADQVISQAAFDRQKSIFDAAKAQFDAAQAQARQSANQVDYAVLHADHDGVISAIEAEAGQVVSAGQAVARLAWSGATEVAVNIPEDQIQRIAVGMPVQVSLWTSAAQTHAGVVRELSSSADPATRTYAMRVSVPDAPAEMRLGMTASVRIPLENAPRLFQVPLSAFVEQQGKQGVWIVDPASGAISFREAGFAGASGNEILIAQGLKDGDVVVTAGAPLLHAGQRVRVLEQPSVAER